MPFPKSLRSFVLFALVVAASSTSAQQADKKADGDVVDESIVPEVYSFKTVNAFDGKISLSTLFIQTEPFGASTGYVNPTIQLDWDGILGSPFSAHIDLDGRFPLFEPRNTQIIGRDGVLSPPEQGVARPENYYRSVGTFASGRFYDWYLRVNEIYGEYATSSFSTKLGRFMLRQVAQNQVDGISGAFNFGAHEIGAFAGLKSNPFHHRLVGATSGYVYASNGELFPPEWGGVDPTATLQGRFGNEIANLGSLRFQTLGAYGSLKFDSFFLDSSLTADLFDAQLDRVWLHANGGARFFKNLTTNFRATLDVIGARPYLPRDVFVDVTWKDLGPIDVSATYSKFNTFATAQSFAFYFRPIEDPNGAIGVPANPAQPDAPADPFLVQEPNAASPLVGLALNNTQLFLVDRDRLSLQADWAFWNTTEFYAKGFVERRADAAFVQGGKFESGTLNLASGLCSYDNVQLANPINPLVPVQDDLCKVGGTIGIRDTFLGGYGLFDFHVTGLNGYFQQSTVFSGRGGAALGDTLWLELGAQFELNSNERVYTGGVGVEEFVDPNAVEPLDPAGFFTTQDTSAFILDASMTWNIFYGAAIQAGYYGLIETLPFQGESNNGAGNLRFRRIETQTMNQLYGRVLWRF